MSSGAGDGVGVECDAEDREGDDDYQGIHVDSIFGLIVDLNFHTQVAMHFSFSLSLSHKN